MSRSINLYIPQHVVDAEAIVKILKGALKAKDANIKPADSNLCWIDVLTKKNKSVRFSYHYSSGTLPNHIALHGDESPELEELFRSIRKIAGGLLQVYNDGYEVLEHPLTEMWSGDNGLPYRIKTLIMEGKMSDENDIVGLMEWMANESFGYHVSHPMYNVLKKFKKEPLSPKEKFLESKEWMSWEDFCEQYGVDMEGQDELLGTRVVCYDGYYINIVTEGNHSFFQVNINGTFSDKYAVLRDAENYLWNNYVEADGQFA